MLKKLYKKNGIIIVDDNENNLHTSMKIYYHIIHNYDSSKKMEDYMIGYYKKHLNFTYHQNCI